MSAQLQSEADAANRLDLDLLTERACAGNAESLTRLLFETRERVAPTIERRVRRDPKLAELCAAEDILQDACLLAIRDIGRGMFEPEPGIAPFDCFVKWFCTIARHHVADLLDAATAQKRGGRRPRITWRTSDDSTSSDLPAAVLGAISPPSCDMKRSELLSAVRDALERISPTHRQVLELKMVFGRSHRQIAVELGKNEDAVRKILSRAISELAEQVGDYGKYITRV